MFQTYEQRSKSTKTPHRLAALRARMKEAGLSAFVVPRADAHQGEYVAPRDERLAYISGFTGSAGMAVIGLEKAALFVDGRYTLQARSQTVEGLFDIREIPHSSLTAWLQENLAAGDILGIDPWLTTPSAFDAWKAAAEARGAQIEAVSQNPLDDTWTDQPGAPEAEMVPYPARLAGEEAEDKLARIRQRLKELEVDALFTNLPDEIAWSFNLRGHDIPHVPVALGFAIIPAAGKAQLFFPLAKVDEAVSNHCHAVARFHAPGELETELAALAGKKVLIDERFAPVAVRLALQKAGASISNIQGPLTLMKAQKNAVELNGFDAAHVRDGVAMVRFLHWLDETAQDGSVDEIGACMRLEAFRRDTGQLRDISFDTISGAGPNGAIVHYRVTEKTNRKLSHGELFLIDSGGQYEDGTTDITRTVVIGTPTDEMRRLYTLVLKGHIALSMAIFPKGTSGAQLDVLARQFLWAEGLDYAHGTGHGVGHYLSVHEGPAGFSKRAQAELLPGMVLSNEPGYYREGAFGIRLENLVVVRERANGFLGFDNLTLCPFDARLIDMALLTSAEASWLNAYHAHVRQRLGPLLPDQGDIGWLERATAPLG